MNQDLATRTGEPHPAAHLVEGFGDRPLPETRAEAVQCFYEIEDLAFKLLAQADRENLAGTPEGDEKAAELRRDACGLTLAAIQLGYRFGHDPED